MLIMMVIIMILDVQIFLKVNGKILIKEANKNNIHYLYDNFEIDRENTLDIFKSVNFEVVEEITWKKFDKEVKGVVVRVDTSMYEQRI